MLLQALKANIQQLNGLWVHFYHEMFAQVCTFSVIKGFS